MIVKTEIAGGYVWIEHDDSVTLDDRIYQLKTQAPGHPSFALGWDMARRVCEALWALTGGAIAMNTTHQPGTMKTVNGGFEYLDEYGSRFRLERTGNPSSPFTILTIEKR